MITSKSLHHSNIAFVFNERNFSVPENDEFLSIFGSDMTRGARFIEDPITKTKLLILPQLQLKVTLENQRLRIDDESQQEPSDSTLIKNALHVYEKLFSHNSLLGFGFNFDIYFRFNDVIPIQLMFKTFFGEKILESRNLRDFGFQFTLDRSNAEFFEVWFLKVTAPLELAVHVNRHFAKQAMPPLEKLQRLFEICYNETDSVISTLKFS